MAGDPHDASIVVEQLTKRYEATTAVDDLSFEVRPGIVTGFLGPNGAGKTTTMQAVVGLLAPTSGQTTIFGRRYRDLDEPALTVGALIEGAGHHPAMTGRNVLLVRAAASGISSARVDEVLEEVGLTAAGRRRVGGYSLGMRQRLGLASALLGVPQVLILDEPANGLDPEGVRWIRGLLRGLADAGRTVFVSSHVLAEVAKFADEVVVIDNGRLVAHTRVDALTTDHQVVVRTPELRRLSSVLASSGGTVTEQGDEALTVTQLDAEDVGRLAARHGIVLHELRTERADLESAFLALTAHHHASESTR